MTHWSEHRDAPRVRATFRNLPPNVWDVTVWTANGDPVSGVLDAANAHGLIAAIIMGDTGITEDPVPS